MSIYYCIAVSLSRKLFNFLIVFLFVFLYIIVMKAIAKDFNFGLRVKELLNEKGITSSQFLKATEIPCQRFYDWCNKGAIPNVITAMKVAEFFNMSVEQLINKNTSDPLLEIIEVLQRKLNNIREICS